MRTLRDTLKGLKTRDTQIEVYGLGYIGLPLAVRLSSVGLNIRGIDTDSARLSRLQNKILLDTERILQESFHSATTNGKLRLTTVPSRHDGGKVGIVCVPTPIPGSATSSTIYVEKAVSSFLEKACPGDALIIESSIEVGTTKLIQSIINQIGYKSGEDMGLAFCPERIDPRNTKWTLENIPRIIYCSDDTTYQIAREIYSHVNSSELLRVSSASTAEVTKSYENAFRLVNISLVNELAMLCDRLEIDVHEVINSAATKPFGFMPFYPSAGAGGHCIPKDPVFLSESAKTFGYEFATIQKALEINLHMPQYVVDVIDRLLENMSLPKSVIISGMSYKPDIEDMRDSPGFKVATRFAHRGYDTLVYDPFLNINTLDDYLKENKIKKAEFRATPKIEEGSSCLCICQHHSKTIPILNELYNKGTFPLIYDCQGRLRYNTNTPTRLEGLGKASAR